MTITSETEATNSVDGQATPFYKGAIATTDTLGVGDRQKTAQRLLRSTADRSYDGELDIDWDQPVVDGAPWVPIHQQTLYATDAWNALTDEDKQRLNTHEAVAILSYGIFAEVALSANLMRSVLRNPGFVDDHIRYALAEVAEESRHSTMFGRLINKTGLHAYRQPKGAIKLMRMIGFLPIGPAQYAGTLLIEEVLDRRQRAGMMDEALQPHLRQMVKIHILEEARHITYAREELVRSVRERGPVSNAIHRFVFALLLNTVQEALVTPSVYRTIGLTPLRGMVIVRRSEQYAANAQFACGPLLEFLYEAGMIKGRFTTGLYRISRAMPPELAAKVRADRRRR